jgi:hypothetical protein
MGGCLCGRGIWAKIDEPGCQRVTRGAVAIGIEGHRRTSIAGSRAVNHSVAWRKSQSKSVVRFSKTGNKGPAFGDLGDRL